MSNDSAAYSPARYIRTAPGTILALLKVLELGLGLFLLSTLTGTNADLASLPAALKGAFEGLLGQDGIPFDRILGAGVNAASFVILLSLGGLLVWMIDSVAVILLRVTGRFSGLIRFIHTLIFLIMLIAFILAVIGVVGMYVGLEQYENGNGLLTYLKSMNLAYGFGIIAGCGLSFGYHSGVAGIMRTIGIERRTGKKRNIHPSGLPATCGWLILLALFPLLIAGAQYAILHWPQLPIREELLMVFRWLHRIEPAKTDRAVLAAYLLFIADLMAVRGWAKRYNREHR